MNKGRATLGRFACPRIVQPILKPPKINALSMNHSAPSSADNSYQSNDNSMELEPSCNNQLIKTHQPIKTPRSELDEESRPLLHNVSSMIFELNGFLIFEPEPKIMESVENDIPNLFQMKCSQCCQVCDFSKSDTQNEEKGLKTEILNDILRAVSDQRIVGILKEEEYTCLYHSFRRNVIRATPQAPQTWFAPVAIDFTIDRVEEQGWTHLSLFYQIMITFLTNRKFNPNYSLIEASKLTKGIISMFQSPDNRERDLLMKLFHSIYRSFKKFRNFSRKLITSFLLETIYTNAKVTSNRLGVSEILSAFVPIIAGFKVPVHDENLEFFHSILLPLHSSSIIYLFHSSLVNATTAYLNKQPNLVLSVYKTIYDKWPVTSPTKQLLFLNEIESLSEFLPPETDSVLISKICKIVIRCLSGPQSNFTVAERALMLWERDAFMTIVGKFSQITFPLLIPEIYKTANMHWCPDVRTLALNSLRVLKGQNSKVFEMYGNHFKRIESDRIMNELSKGKMWYNLVEQFEGNKRLKAEKMINIEQNYIGCDILGNQNNENQYMQSLPEMLDKTQPKRPKLVLKSSSNTKLFSINQQKGLSINRILSKK